MSRTFLLMTTLAGFGTITAQTLVDSIPYPGINQGFWGIHVNPDTIFLGADFSGDIYFSDPAGNILGQLPTGHDFDHGLIRRPTSYLIAEDFTTNGAHLYEIDLGGNTINTWTFPDVIGGHSSGIGDLEADGNAVWYTMYYPDFPSDPYAYAYQWVPGDPTASDTVPLHGEQPYGIALKGDTLLYVTDNLNGDQERIYAYDLANEQDIGWVDLPDTPIDNDQRPQGMHYDGEFLYLVANRQGGSAFAYQTVFKYAFDLGTAAWEPGPLLQLSAHPLPAGDLLLVENPDALTLPAVLLDAAERTVMRMMLRPGTNAIDVRMLPAGSYFLRCEGATALRVVKN